MTKHCSVPALPGKHLTLLWCMTQMQSGVMRSKGSFGVACADSLHRPLCAAELQEWRVPLPLLHLPRHHHRGPHVTRAVGASLEPAPLEHFPTAQSCWIK